jgi:hypothetical protein
MNAHRPRGPHRSTIRAAAAILLAAILAAPLTAAAQPKGVDADAHFRHGVELYKDNDFTAALVEFRRAYEIDPKYQVLYNIAESQYQLQDYANALRTFQKYLNEGGKKVSAKRRKDVEKEIEKLKKRVATISVNTSEPGATITVDDVAMGTTPFVEPLLVSAGRRRLTATLTGRPPVTQVVELAGGDDRTITFEIPKLPPPKVEPPPRSMVVPIVAWSATGAVVTGAVVAGIVALGASSDLKDKLAAYPGDPAAITAARSRTAAAALATDILIGCSAAAVGVSLYLTLRKPSPSSPPAAGSARLVLYPTGAGVAGSF